MYKLGKIRAYKYSGSDTILQVEIPEHIRELSKYAEDGAITVELRIDDGRTITNDQRMKAYATINDISNHSGHVREDLKEYFKYKLIIETGIEEFSLSDCSVTTAREYINVLIEHCIQHGVPMPEGVIERTDDIARALICCLKYRKCCLCGRDGMIHGDEEVISLCKKHVDEFTLIGQKDFFEKHKVFWIKRKYISN